jgi:hypothetical protein
MSPFRAIVTVVNATACIVIACGTAGAQTCSISSTARGSLSCSVTTTVRMSLRIPALVGVTVTPAAAGIQAQGSSVRAGVRVKTNRSYALQIARALVDSSDQTARSEAASDITWSTDGNRASLDETPTQIDAAGGPSDDRAPVEVAFARPPRRDVALPDPIRLTLTIVAP